MLRLLRQQNIALLWWGGMISAVGDWVLLIGLPIYVYNLTGSTLATAAMFLAGLLPSLLLSSVAGVFVDRWDRRRTLVHVNLLLALGLLPLLMVHTATRVWIVYVVSFAESALAQFAGPALGALVPYLVDEGDLPAANALLALSGNAARLGGPLLGGVLVTALGLGGVALVDAASFLVAAVSIALINRSPARPPLTTTGVALVKRWTAIWQDWWAGLGLVRTQPTLATVFLVMAITGVGEGVLTTLYVPFVTNVLHGTAVQYGWLNAAQAFGGVIGSVVVGRVSTRVTPSRLLVWGLIGLGVVDLMIFDYSLFAPGVTPALVLIAVGGIPATAGWVNLITLLQTSVTDTYRGRVWGAFLTTEAATKLIGTTVAGAFGDYVGSRLLLNIQGGGLVVAGVVVLVRLRRHP